MRVSGFVTLKLRFQVAPAEHGVREPHDGDKEANSLDELQFVAGMLFGLLLCSHHRPLPRTA